MDNTDIPVLTKKVSKNNAAPPNDMAELVAQVKQALLPELSAALRIELAEVVQEALRGQASEATPAPALDIHALEARVTLHAEAEQRMFTEHAQVIQQSLITEARAQIGDSIQSIEQAFREAMTNIGKQQVQSVEDTLSGFEATQAQALAEKHQQLTDELQQSLAVFVKQLQEESQKKLATEHEVVESSLTQEYRQSLEKAFSEFTAKQTAEFKYQFTAELPAIEQALEEKVNALVAAHMDDIKAALTAQLKSKILEVLQGIKFVMPNV